MPKLTGKRKKNLAMAEKMSEMEEHGRADGGRGGGSGRDGSHLAILCADWLIHAESTRWASSVPALPLSSSDSSSIGSSFRAQSGSSYRAAQQVKGALKKKTEQNTGPVKS